MNNGMTERRLGILVPALVLDNWEYTSYDHELIAIEIILTGASLALNSVATKYTRGRTDVEVLLGISKQGDAKAVRNISIASWTKDMQLNKQLVMDYHSAWLLHIRVAP